MRVLKARCYTMERGHYSIWVVLASNRDIINVARNNHEHKTIPSVLYFKLETLFNGTDSVKIAWLKDRNNLDDYNKVIEAKFHAVETDEDTTVTFNLSEPVYFRANSIGSPSEEETDTVEYNFDISFLNYSSGSTYRLFDDLIRSGVFASEDGNPILARKVKAKGYTEQDVEDVKEFLQKCKDLKAKEYEKRAAKAEAEQKAELVAKEVKKINEDFEREESKKLENLDEDDLMAEIDDILDAPSNKKMDTNPEEARKTA